MFATCFSRSLSIQPSMPSPRRAWLCAQSHALRGLGIEGWIESERLKQVANIDKRAGRAALKAYDARQRATQLIDPDGLGALQWLWLATPGCGWWKGIEELS